MNIYTVHYFGGAFAIVAGTYDNIEAAEAHRKKLEQQGRKNVCLVTTRLLRSAA